MATQTFEEARQVDIIRMKKQELREWFMDETGEDPEDIFGPHWEETVKAFQKLEGGEVK